MRNVRFRGIVRRWELEFDQTYINGLKLAISRSMKDRAINWLDHTARSLESQFLLTNEQGSYLVECLSGLLLERLPAEVSLVILDLLPESNIPILKRAAEGQPETSIGYFDFVQKAANATGVAGIDKKQKKFQGENGHWKLSENIADCFLWSVAQEFPPDLKAKILTYLPAELRNRMDLNLAHSDDSKVA